MDAMTLEQVELELFNFYTWFAREAPGVTPVETGTLGDLWALFDALIWQEEDNG